MLEGLAPKKKDMLCSLMRRATERLDEADMQILLDALADPMWSNNGLAEALRERGFETSEPSVRKHRLKSCICANAR